VPAGYKKIAPASLDDSGQMLGQTAAIFRGSLKSVQFTYEGCAGPRTNYVFSDSSNWKCWSFTPTARAAR
jgi:hypothetical protein